MIATRRTHLPFATGLALSILTAIGGCGGGGSSSSLLSYDQIILNDHPTAYWKLNETSGSVATDLSPNGWNGSYQGSVSLGQTDSKGDVFPQFSGGYVISNPADYSPFYASGSVSIEAWYKPDSSINTRPEVVVAKGTDENPHNDGTILLYGRPSDQVFLSDGTSLGETAAIATSVGVWHHYVAIWNSQLGQCSLWLDGVLIGRTAKTFIIPTNTGAFTVGEQTLPGYNYTFSGAISDVAIYSYPLTAAQVKNHFLTGMPIHPSN